MSARTMRRTPPPLDYESVGGFVGDMKTKEDGPTYIGPAWWTEKMNDVY